MQNAQGMPAQTTQQAQPVQQQVQQPVTKYLLPRIEAIHAGTTRNFNHYLAEKLKGDPVKKTGVYSWISPYPKPVIYNHDTNSDATGRIQNAIYTDYTEAGKPGIILIPKITDPKAIKALEDGRLLTVSVGATTDSVICSITGKDILKDGFTGYEKGQYYDGKLCEWILGDLWFDELSWVNVPADQEAMVVDTQTSIFLEPSEELDSKLETPGASLQESFGVIPSMSVVVSSKLNKQNESQEEHDPMSKELDKEKVLDEEEKETVEEIETAEEKETSKEPELADEPEIEAEVVPDETPEIDSEKDEEAKIEVEKDKEETKESTDAELLELKLENAGLHSQVETLTQELKQTYVERIMSKTKMQESKREGYETRLVKRTLESLRDKLTDLEEELEYEETEVKEAAAPRKQVESPVPGVQESTKKVISQEDKINAIASLFKA